MTAEMVSDRTARESFVIYKLLSESYQVNCQVCEGGRDLGVWDYRSNALNKGYAHAHLAHGISSPRGMGAATHRLFQEPPTIPLPDPSPEIPV